MQQTKLRMPEGDSHERGDRSLQKSHPGKQAGEGTNRKGDCLAARGPCENLIITLKRDHSIYGQLNRLRTQF